VGHLSADRPVISPADGFREPLANTAQVVRLTAVAPIADPLLGPGWPVPGGLVAEDALARSTPSASMPARRGQVTIAPTWSATTACWSTRAEQPRPGGGYWLTSAATLAGRSRLALDRPAARTGWR
jgi:hypothetical protein